MILRIKAIGFGTSDLLEGGQDIIYGLIGNQEATSWNVIRDTAFKGHEEEYYLLEALISQGAAAGPQFVESMGYAETARMEGAAAKNPGSTESHEYSQLGTVADGRGEEYENFLKEGSKEGLTDAEKYGIARVAEHLKLTLKIFIGQLVQRSLMIYLIQIVLGKDQMAAPLKPKNLEIVLKKL